MKDSCRQEGKFVFVLGETLESKFEINVSLKENHMFSECRKRKNDILFSCVFFCFFCFFV